MDCKRCKRDYPGKSLYGLSRRDNKTEICSRCEQEEAMNDYMPYTDISYDQLVTERLFHESIKASYLTWLLWKTNNLPESV